MPIAFNGHEFFISAEDWNTIIASSRVRASIPIALDRSLHTNSTGRNRLQYLADLMEQEGQAAFIPVGLAASLQDGNEVAIVALFNPTRDNLRLADLTVRVIAAPPLRTIASASFYTSPGSAVDLRPRTIYFERFVLPLLRRQPRNSGYMFNVSWGALTDCRAAPCAPSS